MITRGTYFSPLSSFRKDLLGNRLVCFHETILPYYPTSLAKLTIPFSAIQLPGIGVANVSYRCVFHPHQSFYRPGGGLCAKTQTRGQNKSPKQEAVKTRVGASSCLHYRGQSPFPCDSPGVHSW